MSFFSIFCDKGIQFYIFSGSTINKGFLLFSKGEVAKKQDLLKSFEDLGGDQTEICKLILAKEGNLSSVLSHLRNSTFSISCFDKISISKESVVQYR